MVEVLEVAEMVEVVKMTELVEVVEVEEVVEEEEATASALENAGSASSVLTSLLARAVDCSSEDMSREASSEATSMKRPLPRPQSHIHCHGPLPSRVEATPITNSFSRWDPPNQENPKPVRQTPITQTQPNNELGSWYAEMKRKESSPLCLACWRVAKYRARMIVEHDARAVPRDECSSKRCAERSGGAPDHEEQQQTSQVCTVAVSAAPMDATVPLSRTPEWPC